MFRAMQCKEEEGESQLTNEARAETEPVLWLCLARRKKAEGQLTNEARGGETELVQGYTLQGGRRRKPTDERNKSRDRTCFVAMPCKEEEGEAKIRHIQYPKPNYKH